VPRFVSLFDAQTLDHRAEAAALNDLAESVGWIVLQPADSIRLDRSGRSIVISGVTWSKPDLELLDELATRDTVGTKVWFFNPDYVFRDDSDFAWRTTNGSDAGAGPLPTVTAHKRLWCGGWNGKNPAGSD
jgi:hypothetical protein